MTKKCLAKKYKMTVNTNPEMIVPRIESRGVFIAVFLVFVLLVS
jgi:hypothetical protein